MNHEKSRRRMVMGFLTTQEYEKVAQSLTYNTKALINGKLVDAASGKTFDTVNPANGKVITSIAIVN